MGGRPEIRAVFNNADHEIDQASEALSRTGEVLISRSGHEIGSAFPGVLVALPEISLGLLARGDAPSWIGHAVTPRIQSTSRKARQAR